MMAARNQLNDVPIPEETLRDLSKEILGILPNFTDQEPDLSVKDLHSVIVPLLDTAASPDLGPSHRAAACNVLCAILERCQVLELQHIQNAILDESIWSRAFSIYLEKSDSAKGKSVRQVLLTLTNALLRNQSERAFELQHEAIFSFVDIICQRQDRVKVKPALQGLAHFLQKDIATIPRLVEVFSKILGHTPESSAGVANVQSLLTAFLSWIVHHDTSLSAGHLVKNFLAQLRRISTRDASDSDEPIASVWVKPVVDCIHQWPDRLQEFKTHVFPHCFLPNVDEYVHFLSYLHFVRHVDSRDPFPEELNAHATINNGLDDFEEFRILLASIQTGKELGILKDVDYRLCNTIEIETDAIVLPDDIFGGWLSHMEGEVRLAGLFLCVYSTNVTRIITGGIFKSLRKNLLHMHTDPDVNFRRELVSYIQRLFNRLRGSTATLAKSEVKAALARGETRLPFPKNYSKNSCKSALKDPLAESLQFITWYIGFLEGEIRSDASYQRRITALRALMVVLKSGVDPSIPHRFLSKGAQGQLHWAHGIQMTRNGLIRKLLDMMLDAFDDIRDTSVSILQILFEAMSSQKRNHVLQMIPPFISRAEAMMLRTGRADHADGLARAYALYYSCLSSSNVDSIPSVLPVVNRLGVLRHLNEQLQKTLILAQNNLSEAVEGRPVHGIFAAIRYIVDQDEFYTELDSLDTNDFSEVKSIHNRLFAAFHTVWTCMKDALCADAPEGHVPEDMEEEASLDTKEILSYSWRGLKEASTLLRVIATRAPIGTQDRNIIDPPQFEELGRLCFKQLIELRHRGAFSAVAQTFAAFCRRCYSIDDEYLSKLPEKWYQETLSSIQAQAHAITRRSGGIPALMAGIVSAEPQSSGKMFAKAMQDLSTEASTEAASANIEESRLPQVHALNCIKEFFMTSKLSVSSEAFIGDGLELAAKTLNSKIWPIRNCGLMLFKALIERLLGSDEVQDWKERETSRTSRFSYHNYPALVGIIEDLLNPEGPLKESLDTPETNSPMDLHGAEGVFPALQILRQAVPPEGNRMPIIQSVMKLLASPHWHLRDMAARTITALYRPNELLTGVKWLLDNFEDSSNAKHGKLLCIKYCLRKGLQSSDSGQVVLRDCVLHLSICSSAWYTESNCPYIKAAFLDLVSVCGMFIIQNGADDSTMNVWEALTGAICVGPEHAFPLSNTGADSLLQQSLAEVFFTDRVILRPDCIEVYLSDSFQSIENALQILATEAPDTCIASLTTLHRITQLKAPRGQILNTFLILLSTYRLLCSATDPEVLSAAQTVLADGLTQPGMPLSVLNLISEADLLLTLDKLETQCLHSAPSNAQSALHLLGFFLDWVYSNHPENRHDTLHRIARYIKILRTTIHDTNPFDARLAAVHSIHALRHIWTLPPTSKSTGPLLLALSFILYDLLFDDDFEIRDLAARATTTLLTTHATTQPPLTHLVPILTSHRLAAFLVSAFRTSPHLPREAARRLTNTPLPLRTSTHFAETLSTARKENTALFAAEKQNLFFDPTLSAVYFAAVLSRLLAERTLRSELADWTLDALSTLVQTAREEQDGALGWASREGVFTVGVRVLCAVDVVLGWEDAGSDTSTGTQLRRLLVEFLEVGRGREGQGVWMGMAEGVVGRSFVRGLRGVAGKVWAVEGALGMRGR